MKIKTSIKSLFIMLVMALVLTSVTPVVLPQTHTAEAAKKKAKKTSKKGKKGKKGKAVNLRLNKTIAKVKVGKKVSIKVKGNKNKPVTWKISNGKVAKLTANGTKATITGVKDGIVAVTAKVGKSKVVCAVYVGKGTYADASGKTRKAFGNPIQLLAKYVAKHPIVVTTGNTSTDVLGKDDDDVVASDVETYGLKVVGTNLVVSYENSWVYSYTNGKQKPYSSVSTLSIPVDGSPIATAQRVYTQIATGSGHWDDATDTWVDGPEYTSTSTRTGSVNINTLTNTTRVNYVYSSNDETGKITSYNAMNEEISDLSIGYLVNVLNALLVDNNTGFKASDIGFKAYHASHYNIGVLTSKEMQEFAYQVANEKAWKQAVVANPALAETKWEVIK